VYFEGWEGEGDEGSGAVLSQKMELLRGESMLEAGRG